jgi:hypothetical protein
MRPALLGAMLEPVGPGGQEEPGGAGEEAQGGVEAALGAGLVRTEQPGQVGDHFLRDAPKVAIEAFRVESDHTVEAVGSRRRAWSACDLAVQLITGLLAITGFISGC